MDTAHQWPQEIVVKPIEEIVTNTCPKPITSNNTLERKLTRPQKEHALNCPRCNSTNTKFCYYNNYSLTQPRYFCKTCKRYWTEGGSLRNIPVGGGSRKNKRSSSILSSSSPSSLSPPPTTTAITNPCSSSKIMMTKLPDLVHQGQDKVMMIRQGQDLNLGFPTTATTSSSTTTTTTHDFRNISDLVHLPNIEKNNNSNNNNNNNNNHHMSALELLTGFTSRGFNSFMPMPVVVPDHANSVYGNSTTAGNNNNTNSSAFSLPHEFKPSLNFSLDGLGTSTGYGNLHHQESNSATNGRLLFPFEDLKQVSAGSNGMNKEQGDSTAGYWTGMLGGGSW